MTAPVELLTAGRWHDSIGDLAIQLVMSDELAKRGVPSIARSSATGARRCIVGGGWLIHGNGQTYKILKPFHVPGPHILNAVTASVGNGNFSWLRDYKLVTVRDEPSRHTLLSARPDTICVPCATVLAEPPDLDYLRGLPGYGWLASLLQSHRGEYVVCDIELFERLKFSERVVCVDTRQFARRPGPVEFQQRNPDALLAAISAANCVIASSLHLSILSMAMGVPFAWPLMGSTDGKGVAYWARAGFPEAMCLPDVDPAAWAFQHRSKMLAIREQEQAAATVHLDHIAELCR